MNVNDLLKNEQIKGLLSKTGISDKQAESLMNQAMKVISNKNNENPQQLKSLLSKNPNTEEDIKLESSMNSEFLSSVVSKLGLSESLSKSIESFMPQVIKSISGNLSDKGKNDSMGLEQIISQANSFIQSNSKGKKGNLISNIFGSFFAKK